MKHLSWILKDQLATRPGPRVAPWDLAQLKEKAGITAVFSMSDEGAAPGVTYAGLRHHTNYISDQPLYNAKERLALIAQIGPSVEALHREILRGGRAFVHCYIGRDRSGFLAAAYLIKQCGHTASEALKKMRALKEYCVCPGYEEALTMYELSVGAD
ncbi:dual specificity protein phosphatase [Bdellovibrionota bacterium FG-2]